MKKSDIWKTPIWLMKMFKDYFDACPPNFTEDYLTMDIASHSHIYINPPYSNPLPFVLKAVEDHRKYPEKVIILLLKFDSTTKWYRALVDGGGHFLFLGERLHYSESRERPTWSSMLCILSDF